MKETNLEIERKYLVKEDFSEHISSSFLIIQGFLSISKDMVVRVRLCTDQATLTIKGAQKGITRYEWEKEINKSEAKDLLKLCPPFIIEKTRSIVIYKDQRFEVDVFHNENQGLIIAEIELTDEEIPVVLPDWIGEEVSTDFRYTNSYLSQNPYSMWDK